MKPRPTTSIMREAIEVEVLECGHLLALLLHNGEALLKLMRDAQAAALDGNAQGSADLATDFESAIQEVQKPRGA